MNIFTLDLSDGDVTWPLAEMKNTWDFSQLNNTTAVELCSISIRKSLSIADSRLNETEDSDVTEMFDLSSSGCVLVASSYDGGLCKGLSTTILEPPLFLCNSTIRFKTSFLNITPFILIIKIVNKLCLRTMLTFRFSNIAGCCRLRPIRNYARPDAWPERRIYRRQWSNIFRTPTRPALRERKQYVQHSIGSNHINIFFFLPDSFSLGFRNFSLPVESWKTCRSTILFDRTARRRGRRRCSTYRNPKWTSCLNAFRVRKKKQYRSFYLYLAKKRPNNENYLRSIVSVR